MKRTAALFAMMAALAAVAAPATASAATSTGAGKELCLLVPLC